MSSPSPSSSSPTVAGKPPTPAAAKPKSHPIASIREGLETVAFVVSLVLMLKLFVVEAFVIPTGSMAETLYGYNKLVQCPSCGFDYPVNSSEEVEPQSGAARFVAGGCCPNCRYRTLWNVSNSPGNRSGDRVLVHKATYHLAEPERGDVVVFRYPVDPQANYVTNNYIKRLWGKDDETIAVYRGDLFVSKGITYPAEARNSFGQLLYPRPEDPNRLWEGVGPSIYVSRTDPPYRMLGQDFTYHNADAAVLRFVEDRAKGFPAGDGFQLIRKSNATALEMRRPVYDNDHQSKYLAGKGVPPRWSSTSPGFKPDSPTMPKVFTHTGDAPSTLNYLHRVGGMIPLEDPTLPKVPSTFSTDEVTQNQTDDWRQIAGGYREDLFRPAPITNTFGYNSGLVASWDDASRAFQSRAGMEFWVGDLMLEATVKLQNPSDQVTLELSKGPSRYHAKFAGGKLELSRSGADAKTFTTVPVPVSTGEYKLRFANIDCRLRVWVNGKALELGEAADYSPADGFAYSQAAGAVISGALAPWNPMNSDFSTAAIAPAGLTLAHDILAPASITAQGSVTLSQLKLFQDTFFTPSHDGSRFAPVDTFYVQPRHYLCLGDNSGHSSDSRSWGLVPQRLMLGKAIFVFYPFNRIGFIR